MISGTFEYFLVEYFQETPKVVYEPLIPIAGGISIAITLVQNQSIY